MSNKNLIKLIGSSCLVLILSTASWAVAPAAKALAASPGYQNSVYRTGFFLRNNTQPVRVVASLVGGRTIIREAFPVRFSWQPSTTPSAPVYSNPSSGEQSNSQNISSAEQQAFALLNADRTSSGLAPLRLNAPLSRLAEDYAQDMINRNFFSHTNPEGQSPFDRMRQRGISYGYAGENLAINANVISAENAFMNSPGHRANILNANYTQVGIGVRQSSNGTVYVVQEFIDG